jgi:RNA polymerase sigma-70 factor, ECF subfamily
MDQPVQNDSKATRATLLLRLSPNQPQRELAWREFYEIYGAIIGGFARNMGAAAHDVPDVIQDVMLGFFGASPKFEYNPERGRFRGYLKACTWRAFQKRFGSRLRLAGKSIDQIADNDLHVEQTWDDVWESEKLRRAVEAVRQRYTARPDRVRTFQAFEMYALLGQSPEEIAAELSLSVESVHQAKSRVSKAIKAAMDAVDGTMG